MVQIRQCGKYTYDVFAGVGFDNWTRVRKHHWGLNVVGGNHLTRQELRMLSDVIEKHPHGGINAVNI